jgi:hypothetical protein
MMLKLDRIAVEEHQSEDGKFFLRQIKICKLRRSLTTKESKAIVREIMNRNEMTTCLAKECQDLLRKWYSPSVVEILAPLIIPSISSMRHVRNPQLPNYKAKKVATTAMTPIRMRGDARELAPLDDP